MLNEQLSTLSLLMVQLAMLRIGQPSAARIISFVQPAQHLYFRGSVTQMARLSALRSRPCPAQDGQRVQ